jgi:hypothetical protein
VFSIPAGGSEVVQVHLTAKGHALVGRAGRGGLKVTVSGIDVRTTVLLLLKAKRADRRHLGGLAKSATASGNLLISAGNPLQPVAI